MVSVLDEVHSKELHSNLGIISEALLEVTWKISTRTAVIIKCNLKKKNEMN